MIFYHRSSLGARPSSSVSSSSSVCNSNTTFSGSSSGQDVKHDVPFPKIKMRQGYRQLNPKVMSAVTHCQSRYKLSDRDAEGIFIDMGKMLFDQPWECSKYARKTKKRKIHELEDSDENDSDDEERDLTYVFPSRQTRKKWRKAAALLNLRYVSKLIVEKRPSEVITLGFDDTTKHCGPRLHDVKTTHLTIDAEDMDRKTITTGFTPNLSHSGEQQAITLRHSLEVLAILASDDSAAIIYSVQDIIDEIDFWMSDRAGDTDVLLDHLGVDERYRVKCCSHIILTVDEALDTEFLNVETKVGRDKLISSKVGSWAFQSKNSIITLGMIAVSKCLSPSHASLSYSLYMLYKNWRVENNLSNNEFKGFKSNRFGRRAYLAELFIEQRADLIHFFDESVDENSNR